MMFGYFVNIFKINIAFHTLQYSYSYIASCCKSVAMHAAELIDNCKGISIHCTSSNCTNVVT